MGALKDDARRLDYDAYALGQVVPTRFTDMDPNRHLNNVAIAQLCEEGRVRFHWLLRREHAEVGHPHFLVARVEVDYLAEGHYPHDAEVRTAVGEIGRSSYRIVQALFQTIRGQRRAFALADTVMVHRGDDMRPAPMPDVLKTALGAYSLGGA